MLPSCKHPIHSLYIVKIICRNRSYLLGKSFVCVQRGNKPQNPEHFNSNHRSCLAGLLNYIICQHRIRSFPFVNFCIVLLYNNICTRYCNQSQIISLVGILIAEYIVPTQSDSVNISSYFILIEYDWAYWEYLHENMRNSNLYRQGLSEYFDFGHHSCIIDLIDIYTGSNYNTCSLCILNNANNDAELDSAREIGSKGKVCTTICLVFHSQKSIYSFLCWSKPYIWWNQIMIHR